MIERLRIFDDATVFNIKGESFRGKKLETIALQTARLKAPDSSEVPKPKKEITNMGCWRFLFS